MLSPPREVRPSLEKWKSYKSLMTKGDREMNSKESLFIANTYALLTKREVKMAGYWPSSFFAFLWTETKSRSIKTQKKNEANIQPS